MDPAQCPEVTRRDQSRHRLADSTLTYLVFATIASIGGVLFIAATLATAELYDAVEEQEGIAAVDRPVLDWMVERRTSTLNAWVTGFTDFGSASHMTPIVVLAALLLCWWWRSWAPALLLAVAGAGSVLMTVVGKGLVDRFRPPHSLAVPPFESSPAFPSGHTLNSWVLLILIAYLVAVRTTSRMLAVVALALAVVLALAMGLSRVYLGHHWSTDVLVGWTLGTGWLAVIITGERFAGTLRTAQRAES